jgi:hypothetical protein
VDPLLELYHHWDQEGQLNNLPRSLLGSDLPHPLPKLRVDLNRDYPLLRDLKLGWEAHLLLDDLLGDLLHLPNLLRLLLDLLLSHLRPLIVCLHLPFRSRADEVAQGDRTHIPASSKPIYDILSSELGRVKQASHPVCPSLPHFFPPHDLLPRIR